MQEEQGPMEVLGNGNCALTDINLGFVLLFALADPVCGKASIAALWELGSPC